MFFVPRPCATPIVILLVPLPTLNWLVPPSNMIPEEELALIKDHVENWNRPAHLSDAAMRGDLAKGCQYIKENMLGERSIEDLLSKLK